MGLRILVQRFGRFPSTLVVDGGKEFNSIYFDTLLARYHCTKKIRPGGKPRFGSVIERLFGTTNTEFIYEYAVNHPQLAKVDMHLMRAIREPAGFAHVLVYGPSGVGKTTMIRQIARHLNGNENTTTASNDSGYRNGHMPQLPLLLIETRPPDAGVFNRTDYYRTALKLLDEPFYELRDADRH